MVIIGGGFAGTTLAQELESDFDVTLIDSKGYFEFTPGILRTIVEPEHRKKVQAKFDGFLGNTQFIKGSVKHIGKDSVQLQRKKIPFDYLALCAGSRYASPIKEETVSFANRADELALYHDKLAKAERVVVVGGGLVGIELASEIVTKYPEKQFTLVHSHTKLIDRNLDKSSAYVEKFLLRRGAEFHFGQRADIKKSKVILADGTVIPSDLTFVCTGITPNSDFLDKVLLDERKFVFVNAFLQVPSLPNVFCAGDMNTVKEEKTAQHAEVQARLVAQNIKRFDRGEHLEKYRSEKLPMVISLGKYRGIFEFKGISFRGFIPALMKWFIERKEMWKRRS